MSKYVILLCLIVFGSFAVAAELSEKEWLELNAEFTAFMDEQAVLVESGEALPIKCATPWLLGLQNSRPEGLALSPAFTNREDTMSFTHGTTNFLIHYTDTGPNRVYQFDQQDSLAGVPDYIFETGKICERAYNRYVTMGYSPPPSDGAQTVNGGDGRYDVYIINFGAYGATVRDELITPTTATSYVFVENDYEGFPQYETRRLDAMRVGMAHEFFHSIQFGYDIAEIETTPVPGDVNASWMEMSAVFMEEEHYDLINDYLNYLPFFYGFPQWSLQFGTYQGGFYANRNFHMYGAVCWPLFLNQKYSSFIDSGIVREIWDSCRAVPGPNWVSATDNVIKRRSSDTEDLGSLFTEFTLWNLFTGSRARTGEYFEEAALFNGVRIVAQVDSFPTVVQVVDSMLPDNLGANYIMVNNVSAMTDGIMVTFNAPAQYEWALQVVGLPADVSTGTVWIDPTVYNATNNRIEIPTASSFNKIALIPAVLSSKDSTISYSLVVSTLGEGVIRPNGGEGWYADETHSVSWSFPDSVLAVNIELSLDNGDTWTIVASGVLNSLSIYNWVVPATPSSNCLIKVTDAERPALFDVSDNQFTILVVDNNRVFDPYPNPVWAHISDFISFKAVITPGSESPEMKVTILNVAGEKIKDDLPVVTGSGEVVIEWDLTNNNGEAVAAGPYLAVIELGGKTSVKKFMVLR
ncbi:MAG: hypothetical protein KAR42_06925 [candidate division Zixibacteria bacterium]|nr:hypothetical protein [candidate division Zixibacteria bacterium]